MVDARAKLRDEICQSSDPSFERLDETHKNRNNVYSSIGNLATNPPRALTLSLRSCKSNVPSISRDRTRARVRVERTDDLEELGVQLSREDMHWKFSQESLEETCDGMRVVIIWRGKQVHVALCTSSFSQYIREERRMSRRTSVESIAKSL